MKKQSLSKVLYIIAACFYILSAVAFYKGYDKITNYYYSEKYYNLNKNAYVGGDAYNYIINGNYATGYYVLSMGTLLTGTLFVLTGILIKEMREEPKDAIESELPEL